MLDVAIKNWAHPKAIIIWEWVIVESGIVVLVTWVLIGNGRYLLLAFKWINFGSNTLERQFIARIATIVLHTGKEPVPIISNNWGASNWRKNWRWLPSISRTLRLFLKDIWIFCLTRAKYKLCSFIISSKETISTLWTINKVFKTSNCISDDGIKFNEYQRTGLIFWLDVTSADCFGML